MDDPIHSEIYSAERLELHAENLAARQSVYERYWGGYDLAAEARRNGTILLACHSAIAEAAREHRAITPAAERVLDNFHVIGIYSKSGPQDDNFIVIVVNLDPHHAQTGWVELSLGELTLERTQPYQAHDLLSGARFLWRGARNFVALDPATTPAHIFSLRRRVRTERDFDYFM